MSADISLTEIHLFILSFTLPEIRNNVHEVRIYNRTIFPIPIRGRALQPRRPRLPSGSKGHPQKDSYYLGTKVL